MTRLIGTAATLLLLSPIAHASLERPNTLERMEVAREYLPDVQSLPRPTTSVPPPPQAELTPTTKILLNGKSCEFKDIPGDATVLRVVLAQDGKTILQIEFSTAK